MHDLRCGSAQDSRQAKVGCAPVNVYGVDVEQQLIERGFELFRDEERLREQIQAADSLAEHAHLDHLDGCIDTLYASQFLHIWAWESQVRIGAGVVKLMKAMKGALIVGYQGGMSDARELENTPTTEGRQYLRSPISL